MGKNIKQLTKKPVFGVRITTTVTPEFWELARKNGIKWHDALARGIKILSSGNNINLKLEEMGKKIGRMGSLITNQNARIWTLEEEVRQKTGQLAPIPKKDPDNKTLDEIKK